MITSKTDAVTCITDTRRAVQEREEAIHFLHNHALTADEIDLLGSVLGDDQPGVRWAAGSALAACGERAVPTLLRAVLAPSSNSLVRASVHHALHDNAQLAVRKRAEPLLKVLSGPGADVAAMEEAQHWLLQLAVTA